MFKQNIFFILWPCLKTLSSVYCDEVTQCLSSLTFSLVNTTNMNDIPLYKAKQLRIVHNYTCPQQRMWTAAYILLSSWNRLFIDKCLCFPFAYPCKDMTSKTTLLECQTWSILTGTQMSFQQKPLITFTVRG